MTSSSDLRLRSQRSKKGQRKVKLQNVSNDKSERVNVLVLDDDAKVFTVTSLSDLRIRGQRSKKVKLQNVSNDNSKRVNVLVLDKHA